MVPLMVSGEVRAPWEIRLLYLCFIEPSLRGIHIGYQCSFLGWILVEFLEGINYDSDDEFRWNSFLVSVG